MPLADDAAGLDAERSRAAAPHEPSRAARSAAQLLDRWCDARAPQTVPRLLVFAAHPDDDVLGLGGQLERVASALHVAIVSDGAPDSPDYYRSLGFERREDYAHARQREAASALRRAGVPEGQVYELGLVDQTLAQQLELVIERVAERIVAVAPDAVMTHPYEGGHPDHDATACAVHAALHELASAGAPCPALFEFASYHVRGPGMAWGEFIPHPAVRSRSLELDAVGRRRKLELLRCHATQEHVWRAFPLEREHFRVAPRYEFREPPAVPFHYDRVDWGTSGRRFLELTRRCLGGRAISERI
jgi:LmbE family N-acetylglucosaminyl deacetylase